MTMHETKNNETMKTKRMMVMVGLLIAGVVYFAVPSERVKAQTGVQTPGTPPIGRLVDVTLVAWPLSTTKAGRVSGTLLSMTGDWIVVKDGSYEHWIPTLKVLEMNASR